MTNSQYAEFLTAKAASDPLARYNTSMGSDARGGITRSGDDGGYTYATKTDMGNKPVNFVTFYDSIRFANWMNNGQGAANTETGAYTILGGTPTPSNGDSITRNVGATWFLRSENEWYKAAYFSPNYGGVGVPGYFDSATQSDTAPGNVVGSGANQANYYNGVYSVTQSGSYSSTQNYLTDAGAFTSSASFYNTFDQSGNVYEWNDLDGTAGSSRGLRGGSCDNAAFSSSSSSRSTIDPSFESILVGFRLASPVPVPEPGTWVMGLTGLACGGWHMVRRRRAR